MVTCPADWSVNWTASGATPDVGLALNPATGAGVFTVTRLGLTAVLAVLGAMRELFGHGTLLSGIDLALGDGAKNWVLHVVPNYSGFLLAILPPGAFIGLGMLIAGKNYLNLRAERKRKNIINITPLQAAPTAH